MQLLAIFGPTAVGKTGVAIAVAERLRERGEDPVAVNCDSIQVYRGLEVLSGAASPAEQQRLEHRLLSFIDPSEEFSAGRYARLAHFEIDALLDAGRRPIIVGGTGLYLQAALADLDLRPPVPAGVRSAVEREIEAQGSEALHAELEPEVAATMHPGDRKRVARSLELQRAGLRAPTSSAGLWTDDLRHPTLLAGVVLDRDELAVRINARVDAMLAGGAREEARAAEAARVSRTARAALGFDALLVGDAEAVKGAHRAYARRQTTWMRKLPNIVLIDRAGRADDAIAVEIVSRLG